MSALTTCAVAFLAVLISITGISPAVAQDVLPTPHPTYQVADLLEADLAAYLRVRGAQNELETTETASSNAEKALALAMAAAEKALALAIATGAVAPSSVEELGLRGQEVVNADFFLRRARATHGVAMREHLRARAAYEAALPKDPIPEIFKALKTIELAMVEELLALVMRVKALENADQAVSAWCDKNSGTTICRAREQAEGYDALLWAESFAPRPRR